MKITADEFCEFITRVMESSINYIRCEVCESFFPLSVKMPHNYKYNPKCFINMYCEKNNINRNLIDLNTILKIIKNKDMEMENKLLEYIINKRLMNRE